MSHVVNWPSPTLLASDEEEDRQGQPVPVQTADQNQTPGQSQTPSQSQGEAHPQGLEEAQGRTAGGPQEVLRLEQAQPA